MRRRRRGYAPRPKPFAPLDPASLRGLKAAFIEWMTTTHFSPHTLRTRGNALEFFLRWCDERGLTRPAEINRPILERYRRFTYEYRQPNGKPLGLKTQIMRLIAIRTFFKWMARHHHILYNPASELEMPRGEKRLPTVLTIADVETIINQTDVNDALGLRDRAILETLYSTGMRRSELTALRVYDVELDKGIVRINQGKGRKDRMVPIGERAMAWIDKYLLDVRPRLVQEPDDGTLFLTADGTSLSMHLSDLAHSYVKRANIGKQGSCHIFRHAMATHMLERGADLRIIQIILGHESIETTTIYTHVAIDQLKAVHTKTHPAKLTRHANADVSEQDTQSATRELITALAAESDEDESADGDEVV
jgi:integrase/recombinase XerD